MLCAYIQRAPDDISSLTTNSAVGFLLFFQMRTLAVIKFKLSRGRSVPTCYNYSARFRSYFCSICNCSNRPFCQVCAVYFMNKGAVLNFLFWGSHRGSKHLIVSCFHIADSTKIYASEFWVIYLLCC